MAKPQSSYHDPSHHRTSTRPHKPFKGRHGHKSKSALRAISKGTSLSDVSSYLLQERQRSRIRPRLRYMFAQKSRDATLRNRSSRTKRRSRPGTFVSLAGHAVLQESSYVRFSVHMCLRFKAVVSLCPDIDPRHAILALNASVDVETSFDHTTVCSAEYSAFNTGLTNRIPRFKQTLQYIFPTSSSTTDILDTCLPADYILLLLSSTVEVPGSSLNALRSILGQGTPSVIPVVANLSAHSNVKVRSDVKKSLLTYIQQYVPNAEKVLASDDRAEATTIIRQICIGVPPGIRWREQRSYLLPEGWRWDETENAVVFWGTIRGMPLQVDRLINLPSYGDFQIEKVCSTRIHIDKRYIRSLKPAPK